MKRKIKRKAKKQERRRKGNAGGKDRWRARTDALTFPQSMRLLCPQTLLLLDAMCIGVEYGQTANGHIFAEQLKVTRHNVLKKWKHVYLIGNTLSFVHLILLVSQSHFMTAGLYSVNILLHTEVSV